MTWCLINYAQGNVNILFTFFPVWIYIDLTPWCRIFLENLALCLLVVSRLNCCWHSPAQSFFPPGLVETHDQHLYSLLDMYVFRNGVSSSARGVGVGISLWAARLLHRSFSTSISALSRRPGHYRFCGPFVTGLCLFAFMEPEFLFLCL
jgi:hypothetical protein